jgi:putative endonuclease
MEKLFFVYIMANYKNGTIYTGMTSDLPSRVLDHKAGRIKGFTQRYGLKRLVYYEPCDSAWEPIEREKYIKNRTRAYKIKLIKDENPHWHDLHHEMQFVF